MTTLKILIILDIQKCYTTNKYQISNIETLIDENRIIIFTQNIYPTAHPIKFLYIDMPTLDDPNASTNDSNRNPFGKVDISL